MANHVKVFPHRALVKRETRSIRPKLNQIIGKSTGASYEVSIIRDLMQAAASASMERHGENSKGASANHRAKTPTGRESQPQAALGPGAFSAKVLTGTVRLVETCSSVPGSVSGLAPRLSGNTFNSSRWS